MITWTATTAGQSFGWAGSGSRYFMVFRDKKLGVDGAYTIDEFAEVMKSL